MELLQGDIKALTELFDGMESCEVFPQDKEDEEEAVAGIRDNDIRKDGMGMFTAFAEYTQDAEMLFVLFAGQKVNDGSVIIIVNVAVSGTSTDRTSFQLRLKLLHIGVKEKF